MRKLINFILGNPGATLREFIAANSAELPARPRRGVASGSCFARKRGSIELRHMPIKGGYAAAGAYLSYCEYDALRRCKRWVLEKSLHDQRLREAVARTKGIPAHVKLAVRDGDFSHIYMDV